MERIAAVSETEAADFYVQALQQEKEYGFCGDYRYRAVENGEDTTVVFLNFEPDRRTALNTLLISATVAAVAYLAVFLLVYLLSKRAIRPMLRSAEQQKQFLTDAGHELKTPLTIISTSADVLDAELPNNEWVASIRRQAGRMSGLIANLITLSRMEEETPFQNAVRGRVGCGGAIPGRGGDAAAASDAGNCRRCGDSGRCRRHSADVVAAAGQRRSICR